ncbi:MAG TPA: TlpA disulfide reductase family protein [Thermoleophilaceae bacterium]|jgi:thiol-disulfide isomerase/thioredoxin|nr:TlpA disulfide reductase family protein [Thermoleophilaceae bacterium]
MRRRWPLLLLVAAAVSALVVAELVTGTSGSDRPRTAPALPSAVLVPPRATLDSLRGRPAVVNFWASWCGPCRKEAPELTKLQRSLGGKARLVGVDWNDGLSGARAFIARHGWRFPILRDASGALGDRWGITGLPTTFVLDRSGGIARTLRGPQTVASVERAVRSVD